MKQRGFSPIFIIASLGLILTASITYYFLNSKTNLKPDVQIQTKYPSTSIIPKPSPTPMTISLDQNISTLLYTTDDTSFQEISKIKNLEENPNYSHILPYLDETKGHIYFSGRKKVLAFNLNDKKLSEIYELSDSRLLISKLDVKSNNLYLSLNPQSDYGEGYIEEVNLTSNTSRRIGPQENVVYGNLNYLFKTTNNDDIISSTGGDGCGGFGEIRLVSGNTTKLINKTGMGCVNDPRYIDNNSTQNQLILLSVIEPYDFEKGETLNKLYTKDVYSGEEKTIFDFKPYSGQIKKYFANQQLNQMYLVLENEILTINTFNGTIEDKTPLGNYIDLSDRFIFFEDKKIYVLNEVPITDKFNMILKIYDTKTRTVKEFNWNKKHPISGQAILLGFWQNKPIVNLFIYPKVRY